jgi:hypothetical protein
MELEIIMLSELKADSKDQIPHVLTNLWNLELE